ncbi:hypothetical protein M2306_001023 [Myroides gitamensis]|nr:hypothetical protein [Myroides odoratus]MDH6600329.1 hypothetical protein [Myroides gitamensis]
MLNLFTFSAEFISEEAFKEQRDKLGITYQRYGHD